MDKLMKDTNERISIGGRVTIYTRGKSRIWTAEFHHDGRHCRKSLKTKRKDQAMQRAARIAEDLDTGEFQTKAKNPPIEEARDSYLAFLESQGRATRTITRYRGELGTFAEFAQEHRVCRMSQMSMSLLDRYRAERLANHDIATVYHETVVIKQLFKWSQKRSLIASNPIAEYEVEKPRPKERRCPTLGQVHAILDECTPRRKAEIAMLAFTGMRSGEAQGLLRENVDLKNGWIHVKSQVDGATKTAGSVRSIPIHPELLGLLNSLPAPEHELFFTSEPSAKYPEGGRPINTKRLNEYFKAAAARAGIEGFTAHSLRHFFKTFVINNGVPREMADRWMGHVDHSVSARYYHIQDEDSKRYMAQVPFSQIDESASKTQSETPNH